MKIHYFQRYHQRENVATANTMLLLSRLYQYSQDKFFQLWKELFLEKKVSLEDFKPEINFQLQEKISQNGSVPDAIIEQKSFKIVVETKLSAEKFTKSQLEKHLKSFKKENYKILLTLAPAAMEQEEQNLVKNEILQKYNAESKRDHNSPVWHVNLTFEELTEKIQNVLDERDQEMQDVLDDYVSYCEQAKLFLNTKNWMWAQAIGQTFDFNVKNDLYYNKVSQGTRPYRYLGLYTKKSVCYIGEVIARFIATAPDDIRSEQGSILTEEYRSKIHLAMDTNPALLEEPHRYFFVEHFYPTDFKKETLGGLRGSRKFNLPLILDVQQLPDTEKIAQLLRGKSWN